MQSPTASTKERGKSMDKARYLAMKRAERIANLQGKYVVVCDSPKHPGTLMYYQDQEVCNKGFWTAYMANAQGFASKNEAECFCKTLRYNNPKVTRIA